MKELKWGLFIFCISFGLGITSNAAPIPASFILNQTLKRHEGLKSLLMEGNITDLRTNESFKESLKVDFLSGKVSTVMSGPNAESLGAENTQLKDIHRLGKFWLGVALEPNGARFREALQELNLLPQEGEESVLSRIGTQVTWRFGGDSQIDVLKDEFLPVRYLSDKSATPDELLFGDFVSTTLQVKIPKLVMLKIKGKDTFRFELLDFKINQTGKFPQNPHPVSQPSAKEWLMLVR